MTPGPLTGELFRGGSSWVPGAVGPAFAGVGGWAVGVLICLLIFGVDLVNTCLSAFALVTGRFPGNFGAEGSCVGAFRARLDVC